MSGVVIPYLRELILKDQVFLVLAITIIVSLILVVVFAIYTIYLRLRNIRKAKYWQRLEALWEPAVLNILTGESTRESVKNLVDPRESVYFIDYCLRFAQRLSGEEADTIRRLVEPYLPALAQRLQKGDPAQRARAARTLSMLSFKQYYEVIESALDDPSPLVAMIAARALAQRGSPGCIAAVMERLHRFENWSQSYLASMLTTVDPESAPILRNALQDTNKEARVRTVAADALRAINDLESGDSATAVLTEKIDRDLMAAVLRLLGTVGRPEHLQNVRPLAKSDDFVVRAQAFRVLGELGGASEFEILRQGLEDESPWTAIQAARGLREAGGEDLLREFAARDHPRSELAYQVLAEGGAA